MRDSEVSKGFIIFAIIVVIGLSFLARALAYGIAYEDRLLVLEVQE